MTTETYRLYAAPFNSETAQAAMNSEYARATPTHVIVYSTGEKPKGFKEITKETLSLLPKEDMKWLAEINRGIIQDFVKKHMEEQERANKQFLEDFERELEKERQKLLSEQAGDTECTE